MEPQCCAKCRDFPQDILMLSCSHDLCLTCAANRFAVQYRKNTFANFLTCEKCRARTQLDRGSAGELLRILNHSQVEETPQSTRPLSVAQSRLERDANESVPIGYRPIRKSCKEHMDEEVSYFCFTCEVECICSECVIHGEHKNHEVKTIRKSVSLIKDKLDRLKSEAEGGVDSLASVKDHYERGNRQLVDSIQKQKRVITNAFDEFRLRLNLKEKQILQKCDRALGFGVEEYANAEKQIGKQIDEIKHSLKMLVDVGKKDDITILNFYANKKQEFEKPKVKEAVPEPGDMARRKIESQKVTEGLVMLAAKLCQIELDSSLQSEVAEKHDNLN